VDVFVTGGTGFIGARVIAALESRGLEVATLARPDSRGRERLAGGRAQIVSGDLAHAPALVRQLRPRTLIHLAWNTEPGRYLTSPENLDLVGQSLLLARAAAESGCQRFVGVGTCFEYAVRNAPLTEDDELAPFTLYAEAKLATARVVEAYARLASMGFAWARIFYPYGPGEAPERLVPAVILALLRGDRARTSPGEQVRDYLHVDDVGEAIAAVALSPLEGAVNIGSGIAVTVRELVITIAELCDARERLDLGALPYREGDPMHVRAAVARLGSTGFRPRFDLRQGLAHTIESWRRLARTT
jgi:nucleoside-diphosphate-sugar epimerase